MLFWVLVIFQWLIVSKQILMEESISISRETTPPGFMINWKGVFHLLKPNLFANSSPVVVIPPSPRFGHGSELLGVLFAHDESLLQNYTVSI